MSLTRMSLARSTATIGSYTMISRVLGFVRDVTIASALGASYLSDAFFVAFRLPNYLRRLFAEGAFNAAFVPMYAGMLATDGKDKARQFSSEAMSFLTLILLIVTGLFIIFMPAIMHVLAFGFVRDPLKFTLAVTLTRITMPYIIFISLVSLMGAVLNSFHKFAAAAATPIIMNLCLILIPLLINPLTPTGAHALAIAVMVAGVAQWLWLVWFCHKEGMLPTLMRPRLTPDVKRLLVIIAPVALGAGVAQINLFIDTIIATYFDSGVSYLYYADRINELPLAIIGIALGTALLPMLSRQIREGRRAEANHSQNRAIELALFLSLPSAAALMVVAEPIIMAMFQRGEFVAGDTAQTYPALIAFAIGLPSFVLIKILSPSFYANQDTKTPFKIALVCIGVNFAFNLALMFPLRHVGMALATSIAGWVNVALLTTVLVRRQWLVIESHLFRQVGKMLATCALMVLALYHMRPLILQWMANAHQMERLAILLAMVSGGVAIYFIGSFLLNVLSIRERFRHLFRRKEING